jgi:hypothetical protein
MAHPDQPAAKVLCIRRPDDRDADGAVWNFPTGHTGTLELRLRVERGFGGAQVSLADRFFDPCDDNGERKSPFAVVIAPDGRIAEDVSLEPGRWYTLELAWGADGECLVSLDGHAIATLVARFPAPNGLNYLRLRSLAESRDTRGFLVESVKVSI